MTTLVGRILPGGIFATMEGFYFVIDHVLKCEIVQNIAVLVELEPFRRIKILRIKSIAGFTFLKDSQLADSCC